ncbi:MAG: hypothetical protein NZ518_02130 [Dehalococcoidia bacterium]|nr:hypothetical protein [Dehalococcoidia bacterium]
MTLVAVTAPSGIEKALEPHLLPPNAATEARNVDLRRRSWRGHPGVEADVAFTDPTRWYEPVVGEQGDVVWYGFAGPVSLAPSPLASDAFQRLYWTDETSGGAYYGRRVEVPFVAYTLGVQAPGPAPTVTVTGGSGAMTDRAYVYCWRTVFGEVGPPSPASVVTGPVNGTWTITGWTWPTGGSGAPIASLQIFRTVYAGSASTFRFVGEVFAPDTALVDTVADGALPFRDPLRSLAAFPPPADLRGLVRHPSGFFAGWSGRTVWLSESWRPHAWPPFQTYSVPYTIRALVPFEDALVVVTTGQHYLLRGTDPSVMALSELPYRFSVPSARAVTLWRDGLVAATSEGLVVFSGRSAEMLTRRVYLPSQWAELWTPQAAVVGDGERLLVWFSPSRGLVFTETADGELAATLLEIPGVTRVVALPGMDRMWLIRGNAAYRFADSDSYRLPWQWRSKLFRLPKPTNLGVVQVSYRALEREPSGGGEVVGEPNVYAAWNAIRWSAPTLDALDTCPLNDVALPASAATWIASSAVGVPPLSALGGPELYRISTPTTEVVRDPVAFDPEGASLCVRVYADERLIFEQLVQPDEVRRLPSGFRAVDWQIELIGGADVEAWWVGLGTTIEDLKTQ